MGYAVPAAAQWRDARRIKDAGFDYIRLSHYPHSPAFLDACDELGLVVMNCIPGWQYFGRDPAFAELQYRNSRELVRRDRNRPSVILWEVSLNETEMPAEFVAPHARHRPRGVLPATSASPAGWMRGYDVFIRARQHGGLHGGDRDVPCVVERVWRLGVLRDDRRLRARKRVQGPSPDPEHQPRSCAGRASGRCSSRRSTSRRPHNDNRATPAFADGLWVMYDYNRGYAPDLESSGCMDFLRGPEVLALCALPEPARGRRAASQCRLGGRWCSSPASGRPAHPPTCACSPTASRSSCG